MTCGNVVSAVESVAKTLGLPGLLGPPCRKRDIALALIVAWVCRPGSKLTTTRWWAGTTLAADLGVADASTDEVYGAMDWLAERQNRIEKALAAKHLSPQANPGSSNGTKSHGSGVPGGLLSAISSF